jgi:hypothetical protein
MVCLISCAYVAAWWHVRSTDNHQSQREACECPPACPVELPFMMNLRATTTYSSRCSSVASLKTCSKMHYHCRGKSASVQNFQ